jgi:hypothetical protein
VLLLVVVVIDDDVIVVIAVVVVAGRFSVFFESITLRSLSSSVDFGGGFGAVAFWIGGMEVSAYRLFLLVL